jgi:hypothetical protein
MAGVKITDLTSLGSATSDDLLYIVDVTDLSESPQGTSKQIQVQNIASAIGLESGTYSPTISGEANGILVQVNAASYIKVGGIATVSIQLDIVLDAAEDTGSFEISLPVASDFTNIKQLFGILQWSYGGYYDQIQGLSISANVGNNTCEVGILTKDVAAALQYCTIQFQYEVLS